LILAPEPVLEHLENEMARSELQQAKDRFHSSASAKPHLAPIIASTTGWFKTYGLKEMSTIPVSTALTIANLVSTGIEVTNAFEHRTDFRTSCVVTVAATVGLNWLHQHFIQHNLKHEKDDLYVKGINNIVDADNTGNVPDPLPTYTRN